ncbi:MAG: hydrogenase maturation protease [Pseudomonadota bacterium]
MKTLVLGIGNTLLRDEGADVHAMRSLQYDHCDHCGHYPPGTVTFLDSVTLSFALAGAIEDHPHLIVINAAELGAPPGSVRLYENDAMEDFLGGKRSVHEVGLIDLPDRAPARRTRTGPARPARGAPPA